MKRFRHLLNHLLSIHFTGIIILTLFRLILLFQNKSLISHDYKSDYASWGEALLRGIWFDNVTASQILILPLTILLLCAAFNKYNKYTNIVLSYLMVALYSIAFGLSAANIPYFEYFFKIINSSIFNWAEYGTTTAGMIFQESSYFMPILYFFIALGAFLYFVRFKVNSLNLAIMLNRREISTPANIISKLLISLLLIAGCAFSIRGRTGYNPIRVSAAYFCTDPMLNQIGVNPMFNIIQTLNDDRRKENIKLTLMDDDMAISNVINYLDIEQPVFGAGPLAREVISLENKKDKNVVIIFMESMSAKLLSSYGNKEELTPYIDSLLNESINFSQIFSTGIHTNHALYSTLYSYPVIMKRNSMKGSVIPNYRGLPTVMKDNGYSTMFFMTHESQYDNMNAFFRTNGFDEIYAQENYPRDKVANNFGVQDDFLFEYALDKLSEKAVKNEKFFASILTISNHPPYVVPDWFKAKSEKPENQIVEYADYCIKVFMTKASKQSWFDNTLFVFLGDHGKMVGVPESEMPDSYNHIPVFFYSKNINQETLSQLGSQVDIAPTLLSYLNISYIQNNFGIDLLKNKRESVFYTADNMMGCRNDSALYIYAPGEDMEFIYTINNGKLNKEIKPQQEIVTRLKDYLFSTLQATEAIVIKEQAKQ